MKKEINKINEQVYRSFLFPDLSANDDGYYIDGHAAVYDQKVNIDDYFYEVIERGAFNSADMDDVLFCINHDVRKIPIARSRRNNGNSTMQINIDDQGLHIKAAADVENNAEAKSLYSSVKRGDIGGMSLIMYIGEERWENLDSSMPTRHITKVSRVREVTAASLPYYSGTDINARSHQALDNAKMVLDNARARELDSSGSEAEILQLRAQILGKG